MSSEIPQPNQEEPVELPEPFSEQSSAEKFEETPERKLSPEEIERVMEKVQDLNQIGTAYSGTPFKNLKRILKEGLIEDEYGEGTEEWKRLMKTDYGRRTSVVHFNIVGRNAGGKDLVEQLNKLKRTRISLETLNSYAAIPDQISILFDLSKYKEVDPGTDELNLKAMGSRTFHSAKGSKYPDGLRYPEDEYGFQLSYRVPPRYFRGIVFSEPKGVLGEAEEVWLKRLKEYKITWKDYGDLVKRFMEPELMQNRAEQIYLDMKKIYRDKPELTVPIYDIYGNLYWPKQMTYEEVKEFVAERERKKEELDSGSPLSRG